MKIKFHYTLIILIIISYFCDILLESLYMFIILLLHELGHLFFLKRFNREIESITFFPFGGIIKHKTNDNDKLIKNFLISSGGIMINILMGIIFYNLNLSLLFYLNLTIIIFNIIPIYPLDGGRIFNYIINIFFCFKTSIYISIFISILVIILICLINYFYLSSWYLYLLMIALFHMNIKRLISIKKEYKYFLTNKYLYPNVKLKEKKIYRFNKPLNKMYLGKNCVYILDDIKISEFDILKKHFSYT